MEISDTPAPPGLLVEGLVKSFAGRRAVDGLDLRVEAGELYALLGPNGAGKTTSLRMVTGLETPDSGHIRVCGIDALVHPLAAKARTAWLPDEPLLYDKLSPLEYLAFVAGLWRVPPAVAAARADALLALLGLDEKRDSLCETLSRGMRQKVALAGALIHAPDLLILDEPLTGLDAGAARLVKDLLRARAREGGTVILTTHILEVAERLADRIGIIRDGRLIAQGTPAALRASHGGGSLEDAFLALAGA
ncbi:ABC transporter ATP-binding protein [Polymorphobacter sp.]|uniref:ABC transporter ATP-binding protein n=1 Tax=Polymorphobacter sp. TaxID=1909290 RepID=UPI003F7077A8